MKVYSLHGETYNPHLFLLCVQNASNQVHAATHQQNSEAGNWMILLW